MEEFKVTWLDEEKETPNETSGFSVTWLDEELDLSKVNGTDVAQSKDPIGLLTRVAKDMANKLNPVPASLSNAAINLSGSLVKNRGLVGEYVSNLPKTILQTGMEIGEKGKEFYQNVSGKLEKEKQGLGDPNDEMVSALPELAKGAVSEIAVNTPKMASDLAYWLGNNMKDQISGQTNDMADGFLALSETFNNISNYMGDVDILKSQALPAADGSLSWGQIGSTAGHGIGQGVTMATMARIMGAKPAYGFYALAGGADVYKESFVKEGDTDKANTLAVMNAAGTYMIDRWFDPLPENIATGARMTARQVAKEAGKAVVKEPLSEGLQQIFAENLVRKIGLDAEQDLFEGVIESMIGALGGAASMGAASGVAAYSAERHYNQAKERALELGANEGQLEQYRKATEEKLKQHPEVFDTVFQQNVQKTMDDINSFVKENGNPEEVRKALQTKADLEEVYNKVFDTLKNVEDDKVASAQAKVVQGVTLWGSRELGISPLEYFNQRFPEIERVSYKDFMRRIRQREDDGFSTLKQDIARLKRGVSAKSKDTRKSLAQFVKENGGINDDRGDIKAMDPRAGILNKNGISIDEMTQKAWNAGYLQGTERPDINQLLDALDRDIRGEKVYSANEQEADAESERRYLANLSEAIDRAGGDIKADDAEVIYNKLKAYEDSLNAQETSTLPEVIDDFVNFQGKFADNGRNVELTINSKEEMQGLSDEDFDAKIIQVLKDLRGQKIFNQFLNSDIEIRSSSVKKYRKFFGDRNKHLVVPYIPKLLEKAKFQKEKPYNPEKESNIKAYWKADLPIRIDNDYFNVHLTVREDNRGNYFYDLQLGNEKAQLAESVTDTGAEGLTSELSEDTLIISRNNENVNKPLFQLPADAYNKQGKADTNSKEFKEWFGDSKVVDGTGKPLVVYHSTDADFDTFEKSKQKRGFYGEGFYFSNDEDTTRHYGKNTLPVYLSIKKPIEGVSSAELRNNLEKYKKQGYDGTIHRYKDGTITYSVFEPNQIKSVYNQGTFSPESGNIYYQSVYRDPKGAFSQRINDNALISLFERADASTFMHETAHFFFEELKAFAKTNPKSAQMLSAINQWLGSDGTVYTVEQTEQFARGFEQYLREGKAPSNYLKRAFNAFVNWLRQLYKTATELNVKLNDEVRGVYSEILGGEEIDRYLETPVDEVLGATKRYFAAKREAMDQVYTQNVEAVKSRKKIFARGRETSQKIYEGMRDWLQDAIVPVEEVIKGISPELYNMNRRLEIAKLQQTKKYYERVKGFVDKAQKMSEDDFYILDLALKNRDTEKTAGYLKKYGMEEDFGEVRKTLDELREQMIGVGVDVAYLPDYFPRVIKDANGLLDYIEETFSGRPEYSIIQKILEEKAKDGRVRTVEDEAQIVNSLIRGYSGGITLANISNVKERSIQVIDHAMNKFYKSSLDALSSYISGSVQMIENKKYFGRETKELQNLRRMVANRETTIAEYQRMDAKEAKWKEIKTRNYKIGAVEAQIRNTFDKSQKMELEERKMRLEAEVEYLQRQKPSYVKDAALKRMQVELDQVKKQVEELADSTIENSVGNLLKELSEQGKIGHTQELRLKEMLMARFSNKGLGNEFLRLLRDGGYIWTLGNFESAITQFGDLGTSAYQNGLWNTAFEYVKAWAGKSEITVNDLGLESVIKDGGYMDTSALSAILDKVLGWTGFGKMDQIAKQTLVNSAIKKARADAQKEKSPALDEYLQAEFGAKWIDVKEDMKSGALSDEIIEYAMFKLLDVQPITIDQMPRYYAEGGKKRMFYMMKSYFIKQLNEYRKICFETAKNNPRKAAIDMTRLTVYLMLFNAGADVLKDLLFGRAVNIPDSLIDNIFIGGSINRYQAMNVKRKGLFRTLQEQLLFPVMMDELIVDMLGKKEMRNWNVWKNVPVVGRPYYWWFGGGHYKTQKEKNKGKKLK